MNLEINHFINSDKLKRVIQDNEILVFDNFFSHLDLHRDILKNQRYEKTTTDYPGEVLKTLPKDRDVFHHLIKKMFINHHPDQIIMDDWTGWFGILNNSHASTPKKCTHIEYGFFNLIIYLFEPENNEMAIEQGTSFQKHAQFQKIKMGELGSKDYIVQNAIFQKDMFNKNAWINWHNIPAKLNRAIFFNGELWHSIPQKTFGDHIESGRITQNFFIKTFKV